jgi:hypothetical protein
MNDTYSPSAELRLKAEACHRAALRAEDDETRATYLSLMATWREIAGQVGRVEDAERSHRHEPPKAGIDLTSLGPSKPPDVPSAAALWPKISQRFTTPASVMASARGFTRYFGSRGSP